MIRKNMAGSIIMLTMLMVISGCAIAQEQQAKIDKPITETMTFDIQGHQVVGIRLLQTNGTSFCGAFRADHGLVVCSHFDLKGLEKAGIPAAMAKNWKVNGLKGELDAKIEKVNKPAAEKGISVGMTVRQGLTYLIDKSASTKNTDSLTAKTTTSSPAWYYFDWIANARYAPTFQVLDTESSLGPYAGHTKTITLKDLIKMHGHPCDGLVTAACGLSLGLKELYPDGSIDRTDTCCITNNSPCYGDVAAYLTGGRIRFGTQKINPDMGNEFILYRISTKQAVKVSLKDGVFPKDVADLENQIRKGDFTVEQMRLCQKKEWDYARNLLNNPLEKSFTVAVLKDFTWQPDPYMHRGTRGDIVNKNVKRKN